MKLKFFVVCICISIQFPAYIHCKPMPGSTEGVATTEIPIEEGKTPPPWLKFLKNKKTTAHPPTTTEPSILQVKGSSSSSSGKGVNSERAVNYPGALPLPPQQPSPSEMQQLADWLGIYLQPSGDILAQDRQQNPDSLYDEMYLDWMKKKRDLTGQPGPEDVPTGSGSVDQQVQQQMPVPQPMFGYPAMPAPYMPLTGAYMSPFLPSLAGFKMSKVMLQAQMDAALATLNITTTPKPYKLKLKITVPGNSNITQLNQITTGLASSLPAGSTFEMD